jgi:hypothetical protein
MHRVSTFLFLPLLAATAVAQASPTDRSQLEGSSFTHFPLGRANARMQTLHADLPGGTRLTGHAYRRDATQLRGRVDGFSCDLQVTVSMSPLSPTQASTTFGNNQGATRVVTLPRTVLTFPATDRPGLDPAALFELVVPYAVPFQVPPQGGTVCIDVEVFGNQSPAGANRNLSVFLDAHENYADGRAEQPGFRSAAGCAAPGRTTAASAGMVWWHRGTQMTLDVALRDGVAETGAGLVRPFVGIGLYGAGVPWPTRSDCTMWSSNEIWFVLPGAPNAQGDYDGSLTGLPLLPTGLRLWCQAGSLHLGNGDLAFGDSTTVVVPPPGPQPIPTCRIVNSTDRTAATGVVSYAVPVMSFF